MPVDGGHGENSTRAGREPLWEAPDDYDEVVTRDNEASDQIAANLARKCAICGEGFASDPEDYFRHATGEEVHMTCYDRMWTH